MRENHILRCFGDITINKIGDNMKDYAKAKLDTLFQGEAIAVSDFLRRWDLDKSLLSPEEFLNYCVENQATLNDWEIDGVKSILRAINPETVKSHEGFAEMIGHYVEHDSWKAASIYVQFRGEFDEGLSFDKVACALMNSAAEEEPVAQNSLGVMYEYGIAVGQNLDNAEILYAEAALKDYAPACCNLARIGDSHQALKYLNMAKQDNLLVQYMLGKVYEKGIGVRRNTYLAAKHYWQAASQGYGPAKEKMQRINAQILKNQKNKKVSTAYRQARCEQSAHDLMASSASILTQGSRSKANAGGSSSRASGGGSRSRANGGSSSPKLGVLSPRPCHKGG